MKRPLLVAAILAAFLQSAAVAHADVATDWNRTMIGALETSHIPPPPAMRAGAIVQASVFDALNGIEDGTRRSTFSPPLRRAPPARRPSRAQRTRRWSGCSPHRRLSFDLQLQASLAQITDNPDNQSVARGLAWGESVADQILAWRATDGSTAVLPPYVAIRPTRALGADAAALRPAALSAVRDDDARGR